MTRQDLAALARCVWHVIECPWPSREADRVLTGHRYLRRLAVFRREWTGWLLLWPYIGLYLICGPWIMYLWLLPLRREFYRPRRRLRRLLRRLAAGWLMRAGGEAR